ncbi:MAG: hypothetical protein AAGE52_32390 [Myxococcota bacterium]
MVPARGFVHWLFEAWAWLQSAHGQPRRSIVAPCDEDFPVDLALQGADLGDDYFLFVCEHAGLSEWPLIAVPQNEDADDGFPVPYDLELLKSPAQLVTHFARGVGYYAVQASGVVPTVDEDDYLVDASTVFLGFGIFLANASGRPAEPWLRGRCAMAEHELAYALALFGILGEIPDRMIEPHLNANPRAFYRKAVKHLLRHHAHGLHRLQGRMPSGVGPYR